MVSKNNIQHKIEQDAKRLPHYGLRRLNIGVASVLLGTTLFLGAEGTVAQADTDTTPNNGSADKVSSDDNKLQAETVTLGQSNETNSANNAGSGEETNSNNQSSSVNSTNKLTVGNQNQLASRKGSTDPYAPLFTNLSEQPSVKTKIKFSHDAHSATLDIANAKAGDTYQMVFDVDPHLTFNYTVGPTQDSTVERATYTESADHKTYTFSATFLKGSTINQPFVITSLPKASILNKPGTYTHFVDFYYNGQKKGSATFQFVVPESDVTASWQRIDADGHPAPEGISEDQYKEDHRAYWIMQGDNNHYTYVLNTATLPTYLDHNGLSLTIPVPNGFILDNVSGKRTDDGHIGEQIEQNNDFTFSQDASGVHISVRKGLDSYSEKRVGLQFSITGHYDVRQQTNGLTLAPNGNSTVVANNGDRLLSHNFSGIYASILGQHSLSGYTFGDLVKPTLKVHPDEPGVTLSDGERVSNVYWLDKPHDHDKAWFSVDFKNNALIATPSTPITIYLPDHYVLTRFEQNDTLDGRQKLFTNVLYHYSDGSTSSTLDPAKHVQSISGTLTLKGANDDVNSDFNAGLVGHLDPNYDFQEKDTLTASIGRNGDPIYAAGSLTTVDYVAQVEPTYDLAEVTVEGQDLVVGLNADAGDVYAQTLTWKNIDNATAEFRVAVPKNTVVSQIDRDQNYWQAPTYSMTPAGQQLLTFKLKAGLHKGDLSAINETPVVHFKTTSVYVPALRTENGWAKIIMNGIQQDQKAFTVNIVASTADYLMTTAQGNLDASSTTSAKSSDKKTDNVTLNYSFVNGNQDSDIAGVTLFGNLPQTIDGKSQFNANITGPVTVENYLTGQSLGNIAKVYYSTNYYDPQTVEVDDLTGFVPASSVSDWSKIESFKVVFSQPLTGGSVYAAKVPAKIDDLVHNVGHSSYLSGAVFGNRILPFRVVAAGDGSAKLTIDGVSTVHQKLHYKKADGTDVYIDLGKDDDIKLVDTKDKLSVTTTQGGRTVYKFPADALRKIPQYYHWDEQAPTVVNDDSASYPDGLPNKTAQLNQISQYYFDGDSVVWNLIADQQETITVDEVINYYYYGSNGVAYPQYRASVPAIAYVNPLTNEVEGVELDNALAKVTSPTIEHFYPLHGSFDGIKAKPYQIKPDQFNKLDFTLDLKNHAGHIKHDEYYINAAAQLIVVDPNSNLVKKIADKLKPMIDAGHTGVESGQGFYHYPNAEFKDPNFFK